MANFDPRSQSIFDDTPGRSAHVNACVGENGYVDLETYATGYFEASKQLLHLVLDPHNGLTQDALVYPILFNFRHGIELSIKRTTQVLDGCKIIGENNDQNGHDLKELWARFSNQAKADRRLLQAEKKLAPVIDQIHEADPVAQEFRYATINDGVPSLKDRRIVDLATVLDLVEYSSNEFKALFGLAEMVCTERKFGSYTRELNREELRQLSLELPDAKTWSNSEVFNATKEKWMREYGLSNNAFCRAIVFIKNHREFAGNIGLHAAFKALDERILDQLMNVSLDVLQYDSSSESASNKKFIFYNPTNDYFNKTGIVLTKDLVWEISTLCYLGRDCIYSEEYPLCLENRAWPEGPVAEEILRQEFMHVFKKPAFVQYMCRALLMTGHPHLASKYEGGLNSIKASVPLFRKFNLGDLGT